MISFREATREDVPTLVGLLAADPLGAQREDASHPLPAAYAEAFEAIDCDPNQELVVATLQGVVVGVLQITFVPSLTYRGGWRAQIEGVRVGEAVRSQGVGRSLIGHAITRAEERGCRLVQLTTDKRRPEAVAFYQSLGFMASHEGMKLRLD
jgi:ribosomal protein S18 acetylase RimI-like enzyme